MMDQADSMAGKEPSPSRGDRWIHLLGMAVLVLWAMLLMALLANGRYRLYLIPGFWVLLTMGLVILALSFAAKFALGRSHGHDSNVRAAVIRTGLLLIPLLFLAGGYGESLGSYALGKRRIGGVTGMMNPGAFGSGASSGSALDEASLAGEGFMEIDLLKIAWNFLRLGGKKVDTVGQVARDENAPEDHFVIFRFVITCCVADSQPVALLVHFKGQEDLTEDEWVRVKGVLEITGKDGENVLIIRADSVEKVEEPRDIYIYGF